jgi:hypothetical protein
MDSTLLTAEGPLENNPLVPALSSFGLEKSVEDPLVSGIIDLELPLGQPDKLCDSFVILLVAGAEYAEC